MSTTKTRPRREQMRLATPVRRTNRGAGRQATSHVARGGRLSRQDDPQSRVQHAGGEEVASDSTTGQDEPISCTIGQRIRQVYVRRLSELSRLLKRNSRVGSYFSSGTSRSISSASSPSFIPTGGSPNTYQDERYLIVPIFSQTFVPFAMR